MAKFVINKGYSRSTDCLEEREVEANQVDESNEFLYFAKGSDWVVLQVKKSLIRTIDRQE